MHAFSKSNKYQNFLLPSFANMKVKPDVFEPGPLVTVIPGAIHKYN